MKKLLKIVLCLLSVLLLAFLILAVFFSRWFADMDADLEKVRNDFRADMITITASEELSANFSKDSYLSLAFPWCVACDLIAEIEDNDDSYDYWIYDEKADIVLEAFYDSWDMTTDVQILTKNDYVYPDVFASAINYISFSNKSSDWSYNDDYDENNAIIPDLTEEELNKLREIAFKGIPDEEKIVLDEEIVENAQRRTMYWFFKEEENLCYREGGLIKTADGKYYVDVSYYASTFYEIPEEICKKIDAALGNTEF